MLVFAAIALGLSGLPASVDDLMALARFTAATAGAGAAIDRIDHDQCWQNLLQATPSVETTLVNQTPREVLLLLRLAADRRVRPCVWSAIVRSAVAHRSFGSWYAGASGSSGARPDSSPIKRGC